MEFRKESENLRTPKTNCGVYPIGSSVIIRAYFDVPASSLIGSTIDTRKLGEPIKFEVAGYGDMTYNIELGDLVLPPGDPSYVTPINIPGNDYSLDKVSERVSKDYKKVIGAGVGIKK